MLAYTQWTKELKKRDYYKLCIWSVNKHAHLDDSVGTQTKTKQMKHIFNVCTR